MEKLFSHFFNSDDDIISFYYMLVTMHGYKCMAFLLSSVVVVIFLNSALVGLQDRKPFLQLCPFLKTV